MSRLFALVTAVLLGLGTLSAGAAAQDTAGTTILGPNGEALAVMTVDAIVDPFEAYDPSTPSIRGYHYVLIDLTVVTNGSRPFQFDPGSLLLRDGDGFLYGDTTVYRAADAAGPDLAYQEIPGGETVSGVVGFQVLNGVALSGLWLIPGSGQLVLLQSLGGDPSGVGDDVALIGHDGSEIGTVTVADLIDPFEDYPDEQAPERGNHYVRLELFVENTGARPIVIDPSTVFLQDTDGFLYGAVSLPSAEGGAPALDYGELAPGNAVGGAITFGVLNGVTLARVLYQPANDRLLVPVDLTEPDSSSAATTRDDDPTPDGTTDDPANGSADVDCAEIMDWLGVVYTDSSVVTSVVGSLMAMQIDEDPAYAETAHQVAEAFLFSAESLQSEPAPAAVAELNGDLADAYAAYGQALEAYATATEGGDQAEIDAAGQALFDAEPALITAIQAVEALATECGIAQG